MRRWRRKILDETLGKHIYINMNINIYINIYIYNINI